MRGPETTQFTYEIRVQGQVSDAWLLGFDEICVETGSPTDPPPVVATRARLTADQSGLIGALRQLHGVGLVLLSVRRVA